MLANKRGSIWVKLHFHIGLRRILAVIGTYRHRIDAIACTSKERKHGFHLPASSNWGSELYTNLTSVLLLGSIGIGKRCFENRNNSTISNLFTGGLLLSRESSKVCFELLKTFRVTPKTLLPTAYPPKSISLFLTFDAQSPFLFVPLQDKILIKGKKSWDCLLSFQGLPKRLSPDLLC